MWEIAGGVLLGLVLWNLLLFAIGAMSAIGFGSIGRGILAMLKFFGLLAVFLACIAAIAVILFYPTARNEIQPYVGGVIAFCFLFLLFERARHALTRRAQVEATSETDARCTCGDDPALCRRHAA